MTRPQYAIYKGSGFGLAFGTFGRGHDIFIADNANINTNSHTNFGNSYYVPSEVKSSYTILAGTNSFTPNDWEVFYLG